MDLKNIRKVYRVLSTLRDHLGNDLPVQQALCFALVSTNEGITMPEITQKLGMPQGSVSRNVKALSRYATAKGEIKGLDLVYTSPDLYERRRLAVYLTDRGKELAEKLCRILEEEE